MILTAFQPVTTTQYLSIVFDLMEQAEPNLSAVASLQAIDEHQPIYQKSTYPIIINPYGDEVQVVNAIFSLYPEWAKQPIGYASYLANFTDIKNNRTFKKPFKKNQFCLIPVQAIHLADTPPADLFEPSEQPAISSPLPDDLFTFQATAEEDFIWLAGVYEHNAEFDIDTYSFALFTQTLEQTELSACLSACMTCMNSHTDSQPSVARLPLTIPPKHADKYLVSNWKYIARYLQFDAHLNLKRHTL